MSNKLIIPLMKKYWKLLLSTLIITALGASMMIGLSSSHLSLSKSLDSYVEEYHYPDIVIDTEISSNSKKDEIKRIEGVQDVNERLGLTTTLQDKTGRYLTAKIFSYGDKDFQEMYVWSSLKQEVKESVMLEYNFATDNNISVGDKVKIKVGDEYREYIVSKIISLPESLATSISNNTSISNTDFGYIYASRELLVNESNKEEKKAVDEVKIKISELETKEEEITSEFQRIEKEISKAEAELKSKTENFNAQKIEINKQIEDLKEAKKELEQTKKDLIEMKKEIAKDLNEFETIYTELEDKKETIYIVKHVIKLIDKITARLDKWYSHYNYKIIIVTSTGLKNAKIEIYNYLNRYNIGEENIDAILKILYSNYDKAKENLNNLSQTIQEKLDEVNSKINEASNGISQLENTISVAEVEIEKAQKEIDNSKEQLQENKNKAQREIDEARQKLNEALEEITVTTGYEEYFNQILIECKKNADVESIKEKVEKILEDIEINNISVYEESAVKKRIDINLEPIETMSIFMPIIFFSIVLIVVFLFLSLIIKQSRSEIGILRALGFRKSKIRKIFCIISLIISILAIILGTIIGMILMEYMGTTYRNFFPLPEMQYSINWKMYIMCSVSIILIGQIATIISSFSIEKVEPVEAMSRNVIKDSKVPKIIKIITKGRKPFTKFSIITFYRNKIKVIFSIITMASSVMLVFSALSFITSKNYLLDELFNERIKYDAQIFMKNKPQEELINKLQNIQGVKNIEIAKYYNIDISANGKKETVVINALTTETNSIKIFDSNKNEIKIPNKGIILERHIADRLGVKKGDYVEIGNVNLKITDISEQSIDRIQYISINQAKILQKCDYETILLNIDKEKEQYLLSILTNENDYLYTVLTDLLYESNLKVFKTYDIATYIIILFAVIIGFIIIINNTVTNLLDQKKKLCVLRVLGFQRSEISRHWFMQSFIQFIMSIIIGLPAGVIISKVALLRLSTIDREYVYANGNKEFIITAVLVFCYMIISHFLAMKTLKKWDIVSTVNEKE